MIKYLFAVSCLLITPLALAQAVTTDAAVPAAAVAPSIDTTTAAPIATDSTVAQTPAATITSSTPAIVTTTPAEATDDTTAITTNITNAACPPPSYYQLPAGYRLAGISPSCQGVPIATFEDYP